MANKVTITSTTTISNSLASAAFDKTKTALSSVWDAAKKDFNNAKELAGSMMKGDVNLKDVTSNVLNIAQSAMSNGISASAKALATKVLSNGAGALMASKTATPSTAVADSYSQSLETTFKQLQAQQRSDMRVSLRVAPLQNVMGESASIIDRLQYVLGNQITDVNGSTTTATNDYSGTAGTTLYGFLFDALAKNVGLIFPYTPQISYNQQVKYDTTEIFQSNLSLNNYAGTPCPSIGINAKFTADTKQNAKYLLSALWFLKAVTKTDFGVQATVADRRVPGTPPPTLYLHGYGDYIFNYIPVVIKGFSYTFPEDRDYTTIMFNLANAVKFVEYFADDSYNPQVNKNASSIYTIRNMLPIQMDVKIDLLVQPNIYEHVQNFDLQSFKEGNIHIKNNPVKGSTAPQYSLADSYRKSGWTW